MLTLCAYNIYRILLIWNTADSRLMFCFVIRNKILCSVLYYNAIDIFEIQRRIFFICTAWHEHLLELKFNLCGIQCAYTFLNFQWSCKTECTWFSWTVQRYLSFIWRSKVIISNTASMFSKRFLVDIKEIHLPSVTPTYAMEFFK